MKNLQSQTDRESRSTRRVEAILRRQDGREIGTLITNISNRGCRLNAKVTLTVDELIRIDVPRAGSVAATIRWISDGEAGAEFIPGSDVWRKSR